ncbi:hypothetical protein ACFY7C_28505 [Streptomyces sp. NPDC012769]|uniref:hypothetical protein n=1 Tax=Streptomyces sp. NPDC012769 TaxID=3364848 RepID=UPI003686D3C7
MRVRTVLTATAFTAAVVFGGAGVATAADPETTPTTTQTTTTTPTTTTTKCTQADDAYAIPLNKIIGQATEVVIGKEGRASFLDKLLCVGMVRR